MKILKLHLIVILLFISPSFALATVKPSEEQLVTTSHLVVIATVAKVNITGHQGVKGRGSVSIRIEKIIKGKYNEDVLTFSDPFGGHGKGDQRREEWLKNWNNLKSKKIRLKFYLFNASQDSRYDNSGIEGWMLTSSWFGYEVEPPN